MTGTKAGGLKAAAKNKARDPDFYKKIGKKGGANGHTGGFAANPELAKIAGAKGGRKSKRGPAKRDAFNSSFKYKKDGTLYKKDQEKMKQFKENLGIKLEPWPDAELEVSKDEPKFEIKKSFFDRLFRRSK